MCWQTSAFLERAHESFNIQHMKLHCIPELFFRISAHWHVCWAVTEQHLKSLWCGARTLPWPRNEEMIYNHSFSPWSEITMSSGQILVCMFSSLSLVLRIWQFAEERVKHVRITKMVKWTLKSAVRTKVWNSWWPWHHAGPQGTSWVRL